MSCESIYGSSVDGRNIASKINIRSKLGKLQEGRAGSLSPPDPQFQRWSDAASATFLLAIIPRTDWGLLAYDNLEIWGRGKEGQTINGPLNRKQNVIFYLRYFFHQQY